jgi:DNA-directed RNA polymerase specialized sigma24 family protein
MSDVSSLSNDAGADRWTPYLRLLARVLIEPELQARLDVSGVIQQTLLEAHQADPGLLAGPTDANTAWMRRVLANNLHDEIRKLRTEKRKIGREVRLDEALQSSSARLGAWLAAICSPRIAIGWSGKSDTPRR